MKQEKKESILNTARRLFIHYGVQKTHLEEIARLSKVAKATVYNYFGGKEQVLKAVLKREVTDFSLRLAEAVDLAASPLEQLRIFIFTSFYLIRDTADLLNLNQDMYERVVPRSGGIHKRLFKEQLAILQGILTKGVQIEVFDRDDLPTARSILMAMRGIEFTWLLNRDEKDLDADLEGLFHFVSSGLVTCNGATHA